VADAVPLYPLYALLFAANGLDDAQISALLLIWGAVGIVAEVPSGAVADRCSRRGCLVAAGVLQALAFGVWLAAPAFAGYAVGFVVWGLGGALVSGAQEALLYDGLAADGAEDSYARVQGWVGAAGLAAQVPAALAATALYAAGGFMLVGVASVGVALLAALLAARLGEPPRSGDDEDGPGYLDGLRRGVREAATAPVVRAAVLAVAVAYGMYRVVLVVVDARLQAAITGPSRATVTSVAGLGLELGGIALFAVWAAGGLPAVVLVWVPAVVLLARLRR